MTDYFDELMQMWDKTTDEHVEWQKKAKTLSTWELFEYAKRLSREEDEFYVKI